MAPYTLGFISLLNEVMQRRKSSTNEACTTPGQGTVTKDIIALGVALALLVGLSVHGNHVMLTSDFFVTPYDLWAEPGIGYDVKGRSSI